MNEVFSKEVYDKIYKHISNKLTTGSDRINKENFEQNYIENFKIIKKKVEHKTYTFTRFKALEKNKRTVYIPTIRDRIVLEFLKNNIKKKYKLKVKNREQIINELKTLFKEPMNYFVIRTDISSFFDSINHEILIDKLKRNSLFTIQEFYLVINLLKKIEKGVPQGIGVSNYLSEMYMEKFDLYMKNISPRIKYYARYVDDIVMIIPGKLTNSEKRDIEGKISDIFKKNKLEINKEKTQMLYMNESGSFNYLGYCFIREDKKFVMKISENKMIKMYKKIDNIFEQYNNSLNFELLRECIKFFSSVNKIYKTVCMIDNNGNEQYHKEPILFGINVDYKHASNDSIENLNQYMKRYIVHTISLNHKQKQDLYSLQIKNNTDNYRIIAYNKIPTMQLRSILYRISNKDYTWFEILRMNKLKLLNMYFQYVQFEI